MIVVVGDIGWDFVVEIDRVPARGETSIGAVRYDGPAGGSANTAATIAASGRTVGLVAALGNDHLGDALRHACADYATLVTEFLPIEGATQWASIMIDAHGERTIIVGRNAAVPEWTPASLDLVQSADVVWINLDDPDLRAVYADATTGRRGLPLAHLAHEAREGRRWDFLVGSGKDHDEPAAGDLAAVKAELCVVTEAEAGGRYSTDGRSWGRYPTPRARMVKDSIGAGDAFLAGLLIGLDGGDDTKGTLWTAASYGSRVVETVGTWPPT